MIDLTTFKSYTDISDNFVWDIPETYNIASRILSGREQDHDSIAIIHQHEDGTVDNVSFASLAAQTRGVAEYLRSKGVVKGDRVGISVPQSPEAAAIHLAVYSLGAVAVPMSLIYGRDTYRHIISNSGARLVFAASNAAEFVRGLRAELANLEVLVVFSDDATDGEDHFQTAVDGRGSSDVTYEPTLAANPAMLLYTSGTTGAPKGALHGHRILEGYMLTFLLFFNIEVDDATVFWTPSDWAWVGGLLDILLPGLVLGRPVVADSGRFSAQHAYDLVAEHRITHMFLAPTALKMMAQLDDRSLTSDLALRVIASGGEAVAADLHQWARQTLGATINEFYGLTEVNHLAGSCARLWPSKPGSMGLPYPGRSVEVINAEGEPVKIGEVGQIVVRPGDPTQMLRYWDNDAATAARYKNGWMLTGDLAHRDEDGYIYFQGRNDDIITSAGYRIGPAEIEELLVEHPAVADVAVIAKPDEVRGSVVKAVVQTASGVDGDDELIVELQQLVRTRLGAYKYPRDVEFVAELPKTVTGKLNRRQLTLRENELAGDLQTSLGPLVNAAWLANNLDNVVVVDVRWSMAGGPGLAQYHEGHIPGAVFADLDADLAAPASATEGRHPLPAPEDFAATMGALGIGDSTRVVAYDDVGGIVAARLWWMLDATGHEAAVLDGGIQTWGSELSSLTPSSEPASFTAVQWPTERMIDANELQAALGTDLVVLDARSGERYAAGSAIDPRPGHVPGAHSAPATANLADGRWRSGNELADHYRALGADTDGVVAYCGSGVTACADLLGRRLAGLPDAQLFVGSWSQWGADHSRPVTEGPNP